MENMEKVEVVNARGEAAHYMKHSKCATISLVISLAVFISAALTFITSYFGFPETHPLASLISPIIFMTYLFEIPLIYFSRYLGFPIVLPALSIIFALISFRKKESKKALSIVSIVLVLASVSMYLSLRSLTYQGGENKEESVFCIQDAKLCPDGSYVSRIPPKCEFAACSGTVDGGQKDSRNAQKSNATNFEECAKAGYPVMESYPRQCRVPGGRSFIENW